MPGSSAAEELLRRGPEGALCPGRLIDAVSGIKAVDGVSFRSRGVPGVGRRVGRGKSTTVPMRMLRRRLGYFEAATSPHRQVEVGGRRRMRMVPDPT